MARSTKIQKIVTDALATRITATESGITTIQTRDLVDVGDNISTLTNDAQYQTLTQVDAKINDLIGAAPGTLDTLGEIATALADDDSAIAALVAQDTALGASVTALLQADAASGIEILTLQTDVAAQNTTITNLLSGANKVEIASSAVTGDNYPSAKYLDIGFGLVLDVVTYANYFSISIDPSIPSAINYLKNNVGINRQTLTADLALTATSKRRQNLINTNGAVRTVTLPETPVLDQEFEVINHPTSTSNIVFAAETLLPSERHAVQYDGVEWVVI